MGRMIVIIKRYINITLLAIMRTILPLILCVLILAGVLWFDAGKGWAAMDLSTLHDRARNKRDTAVRYNVIALPEELGRPESVTLLADLLNCGEVGWVAANALGNMGELAQLYSLREAYVRKGCLESVLARPKSEVGAAGGGGGPWERVAL